MTVCTYITGCIAAGGLGPAERSADDGDPPARDPRPRRNTDTVTTTVAHDLTFGALPASDELGRPLLAYTDRIPDTYPGRGCLATGRFALAWGDRDGCCRYRTGCARPSPGLGVDDVLDRVAVTGDARSATSA